MSKEDDKQWFERGEEPSRNGGKKGQPASNRKPGNAPRGKKRSKVSPDKLKDLNMDIIVTHDYSESLGHGIVLEVYPFKLPKED